VRHYTAECRRVDGWWAIDVPAVRGAHTQARRLSNAEGMAREVLSILLDQPGDSLDIAMSVILGDDQQAAVDDARALRVTAEAERIRAGTANRAAARVLADAGLSVRDIGALLDMSYQRVAQLLRECAA
jgi:predicted RNase H-like HicB family nuclease